MADPIPGALPAGIQMRFASQLHSYPTTDTEFLQLNTRQPPSVHTSGARASDAIRRPW
jgi:hypothetical protein